LHSWKGGSHKFGKVFWDLSLEKFFWHLSSKLLLDLLCHLRLLNQSHSCIPGGERSQEVLLERFVNLSNKLLLDFLCNLRFLICALPPGMGDLLSFVKELFWCHKYSPNLIQLFLPIQTLFRDPGTFQHFVWEGLKFQYFENLSASMEKRSHQAVLQEEYWIDYWISISILLF